MFRSRCQWWGLKSLRMDQSPVSCGNDRLSVVCRPQLNTLVCLGQPLNDHSVPDFQPLQSRSFFSRQSDSRQWRLFGFQDLLYVLLNNINVRLKCSTFALCRFLSTFWSVQLCSTTLCYGVICVILLESFREKCSFNCSLQKNALVSSLFLFLSLTSYWCCAEIDKLRCLNVYERNLAFRTEQVFTCLLFVFKASRAPSFSRRTRWQGIVLFVPGTPSRINLFSYYSWSNLIGLY